MVKKHNLKGMQEVIKTELIQSQLAKSNSSNSLTRQISTRRMDMDKLVKQMNSPILT